MTIKQNQILESALHLFSEDGYQATSTSKVAKHAKVSEGLIFRHFKNKEGLLDAILREGEQKVQSLLNPILTEDDPKEVIRKTLELPFNIQEAEYGLIKLQLKLKWELKLMGIENSKSLQETLIRAFAALRYKKPILETQLIMHYIVGVMTDLLMSNISNQDELKQFLYRKYYLE